MRRLATLCLFLALAACDSAPAGPVTPPVTPPVELPVEPPAPVAFSLTVTVRNAAGAAVSGLPVSLHFFPRAVPRPSARAAVVDLTPVTPSPWATTAYMRFALSEATNVRLELLDVLGSRSRVLADGAFAAGQHQIAFADTTNTLPGGAYTVRLVAGRDTLRTRTVHSDTNGEGLEAAGRTLGRTDSAGQVRTVDRTAVPFFYVPDADFPVYDELGYPLGSIRFTPDMEVVVELPDGQQVRRPVTVRDGANAVDVRLP